MSTVNFYDSLNCEIDELKEQELFRDLTHAKSKHNSKITLGNRIYLNLSSNDYLGLANDRSIHQEFFANSQHETHALSSSSSRSLTGNHFLYCETENRLSKLYSNREALIFNSGYHANLGIISTIPKKNDLILADKLNHASIIDGMKLSSAKFKRFNHLDYDHLSTLLETYRDSYKNVFIVSETLFSMDGDRANLKKLVELKKRYNSILIVDEAHAVGAIGPTGLGLCEESDLISEIDVIVGTFGKALASLGAFAITNKIVKEYLINKMRPFIFTTALPPVVLSWNLNILNRIGNLQARRAHLKKIATSLRDGISSLSLETRGESHIVPLIIGDNKRTLKVSEAFKDNSILVSAIRPPTVPTGTSRLRFSLTSQITETDIEKIIKVLKGLAL
jgi:8-amino-7-oxononanoate synthase